MENKWILTSEQMPPKGKWVLVTTEDWQKPWEIKCFLGIRTGVKYVRYPEKRGFIEEEYEYPAWTSGHGDIGSHNPIAWMPLPNIPQDIKEQSE